MKEFSKFCLFVFVSSLLCFAHAYAQEDRFKPDQIKSIAKSVNSSETSSGKYGVWYKTPFTGSNGSKITRPFIIIEGFDPAGLQDLNTNYGMINSGTQFLDKLSCEGYDIVILDINTNTLEIEKNAELVAELIKEINAQVAANGSTHHLKVMGVSMGGLIAKLALRGLEMQGIPHRTETYLSFDVPHHGANVPLGYLHFVDMFLGNEIAMHEVFNNLPPKMREKHPLTSISNTLANFTQFSLNQPAALQLIAANIATRKTHVLGVRSSHYLIILK